MELEKILEEISRQMELSTSKEDGMRAKIG